MTMFGQWRLTLRQAEEAIRSERFDEALELASRPEVADHRQALKLRDRIAARLVEQAREHMTYGHSQAAWKDLRQAELAGAPAAKLDKVRAALLEQGLAEMRLFLEAADARQAIAVAERLKQRGADSAPLRRLWEGAVAWERAQSLARVGEFRRAACAIDAARACLQDEAQLARRLNTLESAWTQAAETRDQLHKALATQDWAGVLPAADFLLQAAPDCREARQARDEALRRLGVPVATTAAGQSTHRDDTPTVRVCGEVKGVSRERFILWVDRVGGYLVCQAPVVTIGQAVPGGTVDVPILGDLSRLHATIARDSEGYLVRSEKELAVNGRTTKQMLLRHGDVIRLGRGVELLFSVPCPVSDTARLELKSRHRLHLSLAGILLMAEACVLGPAAQANVVVPHAAGKIIIYRQGSGLSCRADGPLEIDGQTYPGRGPLRFTSRATVGDVSFSLEPLSSPLNQV
jgi:tetratricopeptide (TPR) repeat protein